LIDWDSYPGRYDEAECLSRKPLLRNKFFARDGYPGRSSFNTRVKAEAPQKFAMGYEFPG
jgi:hypothetical protein